MTRKNGIYIIRFHTGTTSVDAWKKLFYWMPVTSINSRFPQSFQISSAVMSLNFWQWLIRYPYADEIIGDSQCGFGPNRSTTDQNFYIQKILEKKWEYNGTVHELFINFKKAHDSVRTKVLYSILIKSGIRRKLVRWIKMCLNESYNTVRTGKKLSEKIHIHNGLKQRDALAPFLFNFSLRYAH
jgi:hypothetical protein